MSDTVDPGTRHGPGNPYVTHAPTPPPPPPPVALYVPALAIADANHEQRARIAQIEVAFAHRVSVLLSESYSEILAVLRSPRD